MWNHICMLLNEKACVGGAKGQMVGIPMLGRQPHLKLFCLM